MIPVKKTKTHLLCLAVALLPIWFSLLSLYLVLGAGVDFSFLIPVAEKVLTGLSPLTTSLDQLEIRTGSPWPSYIVLLLLMGFVYALLFLAQKEEQLNWKKWLYSLSGFGLAIGFTTYYFLGLIYGVYNILRRLEGW